MQQLVGRPMDPLTQREEREDQKSKQIDSLANENVELNLEVKELTDKLFRTEERLLDLKFEKETFDLQYARLQKRITDLENYKLQSS
jgi:DNA repair exonuclease SbcCD ATPase subunit